MNTNKLTALLLSAAVTVCLFAQNLVENHSFESGLAQWKSSDWKRKDSRVWLQPALDKTDFQGAGGTASMKLAWTKQHVCNITYSKTLNLNGLKEAELSFWVKSAGFDHNSVTELLLEFPGVKDKKQRTVKIGNKWNRPPSDWTFFSTKVQIPAGASTAKLHIRIHGYKSTKGTSWVDNVYFGPVRKQAEGPKAKHVISLKRGFPAEVHGGVYYPGESMTYTIEFKENKAPGKTMDFVWQLLDFDGQPVADGKQSVTLPDKAEGAFQIKLAPLKEFRGWFVLKGKFTENGRTVAEMTSTGIVVERQKGKRDPFFSAKTPGTIEKQIRMGNGSSNFIAQRRYMQSSPTTFYPKEMKRLKAWLAMCEKYGFEPYIIFHSSQHSTATNQQQPLYMRKKINDKLAKGINPYDEAYFQTWKNFFALLAKTANGKVRDWYMGDEIYNTQHRSKWEVFHYIGVQKALYETIKKIDPSMVVGGGGCFMDRHPIGRKMWHDVKDHLDGISCSLYLGKVTAAKGLTVDGPESGKLLDRFKDTRSVIGNNKFVACTESGYNFLDHPKIDSDIVKEVAKINARNLVILRAMGVRKWTFFTFDNNISYEKRGGRIDYGMWNNATGSPKPHAASWAVSARMLAFVTDPADASPHPDVYCYVFRKGNKTLAAFWAYVKGDIDAKITMPSDWSGVDFLGRPLKGKAGLQNFKLDDRVLYLEFDASQEAVVKAFRNGKYILPEVYITLHRVNNGKVCVTVQNKAGKDLNAAVSLNSLPAKKVSIKRGTMKNVIFDCPPGKGKLTASAVVNDVKYHTEKEDEWYGVAKLSAVPSIQNGALKGFEKVQPLVMDSVKHLKPLEADVAGYWTGKNDLSAKIYLGYDQNYFYLGAEITDDVPVSRNSGVRSWDQDAIQCAFETANNEFDSVLTPGGYDADDREFTIAATPEGPELFCGTGSPDIARKVIGKPQIVRTGNKTVYLVRFPWKNLANLKPVKGTVFGFNIVIFDFDAKDARVSTQLEFSPGITYGKTPAFFRRFILE